MDRGYALAWKQDQAAICHGCGTRQDDWVTDPDDPEWVPLVPHHWTCPGCAALAEEHERFEKDPLADRPLPGQKAYLLPIEFAHTVIREDD